MGKTMEHLQVISRNAIPPIEASERSGEARELGELRDFRWNALLREFMPASPGFSVRWVRLKQHEVLVPQPHSTQSLLVFFAGSGNMLGDHPRPVAKDDVVVVPPGCTHAYVGGPDGLQAVSIQFGEGHALEPERPRVQIAPEDSFDEVLAYHRRRLEQFRRLPLFDLLTDGTLDDFAKRKVMLDAIQIWLAGSQMALFSRQAGCVDPRFASLFLQDMNEEAMRTAVGDELPYGTLRKPPRHDPTLDAISSWFSYQMLVLDNVEKLALHHVVRSATAAYYDAVAPLLALHAPDELGERAERLEGALLGEETLRQQAPRTHRRLRLLIEEAWDMLSAISDRVVELTRAG